MINELKSLLMTFVVCLSVGWVFQQLSMPAPYLLGSLLGAWVVGKGLPEWLPELGVPRWFHMSVVLGLSTLIGATFSPEMLSKLTLWAGTVIAMLITTVVSTLAGFIYLHRVRGYERMLALLCTLPGGQAEVIALSRDLVNKDYVVAFCHLVRVAFVVCLIPLLLAFTQGSEGVIASYQATAALPGVMDLSPHSLLQFLGIAAGGYWLAKVCRIPIPHLLGPLLLSSALHLTGWVHLPRINEFIVLAQVTIGGGIGAKLSRINTRELFGYLGDAVMNSVIVVSLYCGVALLISWMVGLEPMKMVLAFVPGGIYEVTVLALIFGFDVAFVAFHHTVRVVLIFLCLPWVATRQ